MVKYSRTKLYPSKHAPANFSKVSKKRKVEEARTPPLVATRSPQPVVKLPPSKVQHMWIGHMDLDSTEDGRKMLPREMSTRFEITDGEYRIEEAPMGDNAHTWLMEYMANNETVVAVMELTVHRPDGTIRKARYKRNRHQTLRVLSACCFV